MPVSRKRKGRKRAPSVAEEVERLSRLVAKAVAAGDVDEVLRLQERLRPIRWTAAKSGEKVRARFRAADRLLDQRGVK